MDSAILHKLLGCPDLSRHTSRLPLARVNHTKVIDHLETTQAVSVSSQWEGPRQWAPE